MSVSPIPAAGTYFGDGVTQAYVIPFGMLDSGDLDVYINNVLEDPANYSVTGDTSAYGATITFPTAPAVGVKINLVRSTELSQDSVYPPYGPYRAEQHEADFDKAMLIAQELRWRVDNPLPVSALEVTFDPENTNYFAIDVQTALVEVDNNFRNADLALTDAFTQADLLRAPASTKILSQDPNTLAILHPTIDGDVTLSPVTNVPLGLVKLGADGRIPGTLIGSLGLVFKGMWDPNIQGATPPPSGNTNGDFYIFSSTGNVTLAEQTNLTPHTVAVFINDEMIYDSVTAKWFYVNAAQPALITAAAVAFTPAGSIGATNVQNAIAELDDTLSYRFIESGDEIIIYRVAKTVLGTDVLEQIIASSADGVRLLRAKQNKFALEANGVIVYGNDASGLTAQNSGIAFKSVDGITLGKVGFLGDSSFYVVSYRPGAVLRLVVTNSAGVLQSVLAGNPDGSTSIHERGLPRAAVDSGGLIIYSPDANAVATPTDRISFQTSDGVSLARMGFLGPVDTLPIFKLFLDRAASGFEIQTLEAAGHFQFSAGGFFSNPDIIGGGQVLALAAAPTAGAHLTRKDYVDALVANAGGYDAPQTVVTAAFSAQHGLGQRPRQHWATLVCVAPQAGYAIGDSIEMSNAIAVLSGVTQGFATYADATVVGFTRGTAPPYILPKAGGSAVSLIEANWQVVLHARK